MKELLEIVVSAGANYYSTELTTEDVLSRNRRQELVSIRFAFFYLCRKHTNKSLSTIGVMFNRDHATVLHGNSEVVNAAKNPSQGNYHAYMIASICQEEFINCLRRTKEFAIVSAMSNSQRMRFNTNLERAKSRIAIESSNAVIAEVKRLLCDDKVIEGWRRDHILRKLVEQENNLKSI